MLGALTDYDIWTYDEEPNEPSEGTHVYKCYLLTSLLGTWEFAYDGLLVHTYTHKGWERQTGTYHQWAAEIQNMEDQMVGTAEAKCDFTQCECCSNWDSWQDAEIGPNDVETSPPPLEWGVEWLSWTAFNAWDRKP